MICPIARNNDVQLREPAITSRGIFMQKFDSIVFALLSQPDRQKGILPVTAVAFLGRSQRIVREKPRETHRMIVNFAERAHNHNWELDPVTRSLLDTISTSC